MDAAPEPLTTYTFGRFQVLPDRAAAVGLEVPGGEMSSDSVAGALGRKTLLIVLDNCEHVVGAAARMAEALLRAIRQCLSSPLGEPLRVDREWVTSVPALAVPSGGCRV
jgi:non-specific serine/threonine protein kinase